MLKTLLIEIGFIQETLCLVLQKDLKITPHPLCTPSVWVSPVDEITEGSSVTLTCSSDANRAAKYTWYRKNQTLSSEGAQLVFSSIQSSDSAEYQCAAENQLGRRESKPVFIHVQYAPRLPSVSVSPSAEIVEGSSVTLTCSSDANPAANYTWYKENEDSPLASGQIFTITDVRAEHSGNYYCEAKNTRGRHNSTFTLTVMSASISNISRITLGLLMILLLLLLILWRRKKDIMEAEPAEAMELNSDPAYGNISAVTAAQREDRGAGRCCMKSSAHEDENSSEEFNCNKERICLLPSLFNSGTGSE
ncbi:B-cell receptor CD22-like isoform X2 [Cheilinus undulatus]|uniref:B-cell receptor CD22-like isoform X2 n=1 Tax=Cheilinus undulatus TaxID=241271 RepID=UPI001BD5E0BE|nr:B-cell receptor CD22-like isoform X2 [Cheilinus undulatus]